jgi:hypothetical protein
MNLLTVDTRQSYIATELHRTCPTFVGRQALEKMKLPWSVGCSWIDKQEKMTKDLRQPYGAIFSLLGIPMLDNLNNRTRTANRREANRDIWTATRSNKSIGAASSTGEMESRHSFKGQGCSDSRVINPKFPHATVRHVAMSISSRRA